MKRTVISASLILLAVSSFADTTITLTGKDGSVAISVPDEVASIYSDNKAAVDAALKSVPTAEIESVASQVTDAYKSSLSSLGTLSPYTTAKGGLNDFSAELCAVIPNAQAQQNVWAKSWIGTLVPKPHFGFGLNAGVAQMDISAITKTLKAFGASTSDIPNTLAMPTIAADARIGGFALPFDIGFVFCTLDTSKIGLDGKIDPVSADYFSIGGDIRFALAEFEKFETTISAGAGAYYTKGSISIDDKDHASGSFGFDSTTVFISAQASAKLLIFVPFAGARVLFSKVSVDWSVSRINWANVLGESYSSDVERAASWGLLPSGARGGAESGFFEDIRPLAFGGIGLDAGPIDITLSASFDFISQIAGGAFSVRFAL